MLFVFRGVRALQVLLAIAALGCGVGAVVLLKAYTDGEGWPLLIVSALLGLAFLWLFSTTLRLPTSYVAVSDERTRIRFAGFVDTVVSNKDIAGVRLANHRFIAGLGVRTNFKGDVALVSAWGEVAEITLNRPIRVWIIPRLLPARARRLRVSIRNPQKLVDRFGAPPAQSRPPAPARKMKHRGPRTR
ncbi:MAG: hypothetical protein HY875_09895 [Chloroflexi bacterium]|nr:hypothetical protein [Chloroflexota bacterium]